jgi:hypothetical protein
VLVVVLSLLLCSDSDLLRHLNPTNNQIEHTEPVNETPAPQLRSSAHYRHPITNNFIRRPLPTCIDSTADIGYIFQTSVSEPQSSPLNISWSPCTLYLYWNPHQILKYVLLKTHSRPRQPIKIQTQMPNPRNARYATTGLSLSLIKHNVSPWRW